MRRIYSTFLLLLFVSSLFAGVIFSEYSATPETDRVTITWSTKSETNISSFAVLRSDDDKTFIELKRVKALGPGTQYTYIDENVVFKGVSAMFYKIKAIDNKGNVADESDAMIVHPNISGIFRTWGAIKAMFR